MGGFVDKTLVEAVKENTKAIDRLGAALTNKDHVQDLYAGKLSPSQATDGVPERPKPVLYASVPVDLDWTTKGIEAVAQVVGRDGFLTIEILFTPQDQERVLNLVKSMPVESLKLSVY
jgi:hypothetical protein